MSELEKKATEVASDILFEIEAFDKRCASAEYTDSGEVWDLLNEWRRRIRLLLGRAPDPDDEPDDDEGDGEDEGCPKNDPDCYGPADGIHDACEAPGDYQGASYTAEMDIGAYDPDQAVSCQDCGWTGELRELHDINDCILTPGDSSPAGRCPKCDTLAYIDGDASDKAGLFNDALDVADFLLEWEAQQGGYDAKCWAELKAWREKARKVAGL